MIKIKLILVFVLIAICAKAQDEQATHNIVVWGNSITWGSASSSDNNCYCAILQDELVKNGYNNYSVINCGVGGETYQSILVRQGAIGLYFDKDLSFSGKNKVSLGKVENWVANHVMRNTFFKDDSYFFLLMQGESGRSNRNVKTVNPLVLDGNTFTLSYEGNSENGEYFITSNEDVSMDIPKGTIIETSGSKIKEDIVVLAIGTNGGYLGRNDSFNEDKAINNAIEMTDLAIKKANTDKYIVCSPYGGTAFSEFGSDGMTKLEAAFQKHYGNKFLNWRAYLTTNGLKDAGIEATEQDLKDIEDGKCPSSLLNDIVHPNDLGHNILGKRLFEKLKELNYIENTTDIYHPNVKSKISSNKIYSIEGVKLNKTRKGINIVNGKKVIVQ